VKVGRAALDEDAIRRIEESNPSVEFDWTQILKGGQSPPPAEVRGQGRPARVRLERPGGPPQGRPRSMPAPVQPVQDEPAIPAAELPESGASRALEPSEPPDERVTEEIEPLSITIATDEPLLVDPEAPPEGIEIVDEPLDPSETISAAHTRLGAEGVQRLRARHAEVLARISERIQDAERREELKAQAERLNPDTWVTADEVSAGIDQYEAVFEALRSAVGGPRRRRRRRGSRRGGQGGSEEGSPAAGSDEAAGDDDVDESET
jgi:hypothetical protein